MKEKGNKAVVVFETVTGAFQHMLVLWYACTGHEVCFVNPPVVKGRMRFLAVLERRGMIRKIDIAESFSIIRCYDADTAFERIDGVWGAWTGHPVIRRAKSWYSDEQIDLVFKKELHKRLSRFFYIDRVIRGVERAFPEDRIVFVPGHDLFYRRTDNNEAFTYALTAHLVDRFGGGRGTKPQRTTISRAETVFAAFRYGLGKAIIPARALSISLYLLARALLNPRKRNVRTYHHGIMIVSPGRQFGSKMRRVDWLLDGNEINAGNTIFVANQRLSAGNVAYMDKHGFAYVDDISRYLTLREASGAARELTRIIRHMIGTDGLMLETYLRVIVIGAMWKSFFSSVKIDNLVTHADFGIQSICRNILLKKADARSSSWSYMDSNNFHCYFSKDQGRIFRTPAHGYLYYDHLISWSDKGTEYLSSHKQEIGDVSTVGCLWSEHIRLSREEGLVNELERKLRDAGWTNRAKVLGVFDSSFLDWSMNTVADGIRFFRDIARLRGDMPDVFIMLKLKNAPERVRGWSPELGRALDELYRIGRCVIVGREMTSAEVIALSDVTISFAFSSTTYEALAAGKCAVYYDPSEKFRGTYYDAISGLSCHGYDELRAQVEELLTADGCAKFCARVAGSGLSLDPFGDGLAITRFRRLLAGAGSDTASRERAPQGSCARCGAEASQP